MNYQPNQPVLWIRDSWYGTFRIRAKVIRVNKATVTIEAEHKDGTTSIHRVKSDNLMERKS